MPGGVAVGQLQLPPPVAGQPVRLAFRPPVLAGREELLAELHAQLVSGDDPGPRMVALCGLGGAGKTSVAVEYAYRHLAEVGVAWQFASENPTMLAAGFAELAAQLGARNLADIRDPVASVHAMLAKSATGWLLIFDDAADMAAVAAFLPPAGPGRVLITSRNPAWPGVTLDVPVLDPDVAAGFLMSRTNDSDRNAAAELADELGGLPLALEQATAYIPALRQSLAGYLALFRQRRLDLLDRGQAAGHPETVATTWALAFDHLERASPRAVGLLRLLAFCAPEAVPLPLLLQPRPGLAGRLGPEVAPVLAPLVEDPLAAGDAVAALRRYSLVTPAAAGSVSVHRLVQAVTTGQMTAELAETWRQAAAAVIEAAIPGDPQKPADWPVFGMLLPHAQAALAADTDGMGRIASYLGYSGNDAAARDLWRTVLEARERVLGPEHPDTLHARTSLADFTWARDAPGTRDQQAALIPVLERVLGPEHPDTLHARTSLAWCTWAAGDAAGACDLFAALIPVLERVLSPEHPLTLYARGYLAWCTGEAGDAAGARDQFAALLPIAEQVLGAEHPLTLYARTSLAHWTGESGDAPGARDQYAALIPVLERVLSPEHPFTLYARAYLASSTGESGDAAGARDQFAALLPIAERVLGPEYPGTLTARRALAWWTGEAGDAAGARDQFAALLPITKRVLGPGHPGTLAARTGLAWWTGEAGDAAGARDQFAALLPIAERVLGPEHVDTLTARRGLARWTGQVDGGPSTAQEPASSPSLAAG